jgi:protein-S-isoprenylcysteine O-methyltransferase Ste14
MPARRTTGSTDAAERPVILRVAILIGGLVLFSVLHSVLAAEAVRRHGEARLGRSPQLYRLLYILLAVGLLVAALIGSRGPWPLLWRAEGWRRGLLVGVEALALAGFLATVRSLDVLRFLGLRGAPRPATERPQTRGTYRLCRHPLYFFTAVLFTALPTMDLRWLIVAAWLWLYGYVGSIFEERKLVAAFGEEYRRYRDTHWRLLPLGPRKEGVSRS